MRCLRRQKRCACAGDEMAPAAAGAHDVNVFERLALVAEHKKVRMLDLFRMVRALHASLLQCSPRMHCPSCHLTNVSDFQSCLMSAAASVKYTLS